AQAHETSVSAEVSERIGSLESQLQAAVASREEVERARQHAGTHIAELQALLQSATAELEQLRSRGDDGLAAQLQEAAEQRDAAEQRAHALENDLAQLRDHVEATLRATTAEKESEAARAAALEAELASLREQAAGVDESLNARVVELEDSRRQLTSERDAAVTHAAEVEAEVDSLRSRLSEVPAPEAGPNVDVADLRQRLGARERRLAESVGEIAKMNREHRALLQLVERQFQLEEASTSVPEPRSEAVHVLFVPSATGYTLVERDGPAPDAGELVEVDGERFEVRRLGPSPLPGPSRRCAYLERA
ncbi:MAG: hypothetical protein ACXWZB_01710, partial [Gaiellaceae bacterium]